MGQNESKRNSEDQFEIVRQDIDGSKVVRNKKDGKEYLMRVVACATQGDMQRLKALLECRAQLESQHIFSLAEIREKLHQQLCSSHYKMTLVLNYSVKNMDRQVKERSTGTQRNPFQESDLWSILYSCCMGLSTLYSSGATHQSLTTQQIFICKDGFVKISEPLLFGLEKNHLQAMKVKEEGTVNLHLSPEIIGCLEDQNFFYYDKQKSDIFVLGMIMVDLALLDNHFLYNPRRKKPLFQEIQELLDKVGEHYSNKLVFVLGEMLQIQSRKRPSLSQIISKIQKSNNISEQFTVQSESNVKSQVPSQRQTLVQYQELNPREDSLEKTKRKEPVTPNKFAAGGQSVQQPSLCIKDASVSFNQHNFHGRVFASTPNNHSNHQLTLYASRHQYVPAAHYYQNIQVIHPQHLPVQNVPPPLQMQNIPVQNGHPNLPIQIIPVQNVSPPAPVYTTQNNVNNAPVRFSNPRVRAASIPNNYASFTPPPPSMINSTEKIIKTPQKNYDLQQRSKSIDSIKVASNENSRVVGFSQSPNKAIYPGTIQQRQHEKNIKNKYQPLFSHQIPEVYNILVKNNQNSGKIDLFQKQEKDIIKNQFEHVATPQFQGQITKANRFSSFKKYPFQTISRSGGQKQPQYPLVSYNVQLRKIISHTQSQYAGDYNNKQFQKNHIDPLIPNNQNYRNPFTGSSAITPVKITPNNFAGSTAFPSNLPPKSTSPFANSAANFNNNSPIVSSSFIPAMPSPVENFTCRSGFSHMAHFHEDQDLKLQYVKQDIAQRGRYEGYKHNYLRNGHGSLYFKDGGHYQGQWKDDKMHGYGKLYYQNGKIAYEGHWQHDQFNGQGRVYNSESVTFDGQFNYKDFSELGNNWVYYEGLFKNDSKHGKGYIKLSNGQMFEGLFDHDMIEGNGIFYKRTGQIIIGFWIDNKLFLNQSYEHDKK